jgi:hypothetical protein
MVFMVTIFPPDGRNPIDGIKVADTRTGKPLMRRKKTQPKNDYKYFNRWNLRLVYTRYSIGGFRSWFTSGDVTPFLILCLNFMLDLSYDRQINVYIYIYIIMFQEFWTHR